MRLVFLLLLTIAAGVAAPVADPTDAEVDSLVQLYEHLHRNPELSYYEEKTAARLAKEIRAAGFDVTENVGGHGFVAVMRNGDGPVVMVRTDLDGLPVVEQTGRGYASDVRTSDDQGRDVGVMHACGHDIHMSSFVGVARALAKSKKEWRGTVVMIGQPAEERVDGARLMLADGLFEKFPKPDYAVALHVAADLPVGKVGYTPGYAMANVDSVDILVRGVGGHGAWPHKTKDPIVLAAQIVLALQTIVSRETSPLDSAVVTVGSIHGGDKHNVISDEVKMQLTVRTYADETRKRVIDSIRRISLFTARAAGVPADREPVVTVLEKESTPSTYNDPALAERLAGVWRKTFGVENVVKTDPVMGGEDFSLFGRTEDKIPIMMFWLGTIDQPRFDKGGLPPLHSGLYWPDPEPSIRTGVRAMTATVLDLLAKP
ncbi:MAG: amidohydrolase [Bryobacterales bacterium]|nr:amidohydrolase [Acidobacteriota bacterium]MCB9385804.1 amidohydrolase [Bryobacterales bacterium]